MGDAWHAFRDFVERTDDLPISMLVRGATARGLGDHDAAAYDAPFPTAASKAGARAFPLILPPNRTRPAPRPGGASWRGSAPTTVGPLPVGGRRPGPLARDG